MIKQISKTEAELIEKEKEEQENENENEKQNNRRVDSINADDFNSSATEITIEDTKKPLIDGK